MITFGKVSMGVEIVISGMPEGARYGVGDNWEVWQVGIATAEPAVVHVPYGGTPCMVTLRVHKRGYLTFETHAKVGEDGLHIQAIVAKDVLVT